MMMSVLVTTRDRASRMPRSLASLGLSAAVGNLPHPTSATVELTVKPLVSCSPCSGNDGSEAVWLRSAIAVVILPLHQFHERTLLQEKIETRRPIRVRAIADGFAAQEARGARLLQRGTPAIDATGFAQTPRELLSPYVVQ